MLSVHVTAVEVNKRCLLGRGYRAAAAAAGQHEGVEADRALRPAVVDGLDLVLELALAL